VTSLRCLHRGPRLLVPGLARPPPHRRLLLGIGDLQPEWTHPGAEQHQVTDPLRVGPRVEQGHAPARGVAEQVEPLQPQFGAQRLYVTGQPVTAVGRRISGHRRFPGAPGVRQDQLPRGAEATEIAQVVGSPAGSAGQADQRPPVPARRNASLVPS
jgi:hypothetical protein